MKRVIKILFKSIIPFLILLVFMSSCKEQIETIQVPVSSELSTESTEKRSIILNPDGSIDYEAMWPGKTVLVWAYSDTGEINHHIRQLKLSEEEKKPYGLSISNSLIVDYNDYLVSQGTDYVIKIVNEMCITDRIVEDYLSLGDDEFAKAVFTVKNVNTYFYDLIREMKADGRQLDIISTGSRLNYLINLTVKGVMKEESGVALEDPCGDAIRDGLLLNISEYVFGENDDRLYNSLPKEYWKLFSKYNGIYGLYNNGLATCKTFHLRNDIVSKYDIDVSDLNTMDDIDFQLKRIYPDYEEEISDKELMLVQNRLTSVGFQNIAGIFPDEVKQYLAFKYDKNNTPIAINRFTDAEYLNLNYLLAKWVTNKYFNGSEIENSIGDAISISTSPTKKVPAQYLTYISNNDLSSTLSDLGYIPVEIGRYLLRDSRSRLIGIASWSKNADHVYDFLSLLFTDPHLTNMMRSEDGNIGYSREKLVCMHLIYPTKPVSPKRYELRKMIEDLYIPPNYGFEPNLSGMQYDFTGIERLCKEADGLWRSTNPDSIKEKMSEIVLRLDTLGYNRLIEEINNQLQEYWNEELLTPR